MRLQPVIVVTLSALLSGFVVAQENVNVASLTGRFTLEFREGYACDLQHELFDIEYKLEKLCRVLTQTSIISEEGQVSLYNMSFGPEEVSVLNNYYIAPHASMYFYNPGSPVKSHKMAVCIPVHNYELQTNRSFGIHAQMQSAEAPLPNACSSALGTRIVAKGLGVWTNLAIGSEESSAARAGTKYLVQFRVVLVPAATGRP